MGLKVMIVDDSAVMRKIVARNVRIALGDRLEGFVEAGDGAEALKTLGGERVDVVFCDVNMPKMNGLEFLRQLKESTELNVPVFMVTTEGSEETVMDALSLGAKGFLRKPFTSDQVLAALEKVTV
jgi:two-component system chemotaxis response regulator CheY